MYWYNRLSSKFDGRNILVDVLQECCGTPAEQAEKRKEFTGVPQNTKKSLTGLKIGRDTRMWLENRRAKITEANSKQTQLPKSNWPKSRLRRL